jgi:hypothetical protein
MGIKYYDLGANLQLNQIVMAGTHDAGITMGDDNAKTQDLDIGGQANAGVRIFDLRVAAYRHAGKAVFETFHGPRETLKPFVKPRKIDGGTEKEYDLKLSRQLFGTRGEALDDILNQSLEFIGNNGTEFLLLKFDKCDNWQALADQIKLKLEGSDTLFRYPINLNTATLEQLKGKIIPLFMKKGYDELDTKTQAYSGIMPIRNLYKTTNVYERTYSGIQYLGKGGTDINTSNFSEKITENLKKQSKIMKQGREGIKHIISPDVAPADPQLMGMAYWTTTGAFKSIKERDAEMWTDPNLERFYAMWKECLHSNLRMRLQAMRMNPNQLLACYLKRFIPNFIMIDFADSDRCKKIYQLNVSGRILLEQHKNDDDWNN